MKIECETLKKKEICSSEHNLGGGQYRIRTRVSGLEGHHDIQTTPIALTFRMHGSI